MNPAAIEEAADLLRHAASSGERLAALPEACRPANLADGYAVQAQVAAQSGRLAAGWKIAATSVAGQRHIGVDGPIAGRMLSEHVVGSGLGFSLADNNMRVVEAEFAFRMARDLPPRGKPYTVEEVKAAIATLHPALEIPNSRYRDTARAGAAQLIADAACGAWLATGPAAPNGWRDLDLAAHAVTVWRGDSQAGEGCGANVLGSPYLALTWLANELHVYGEQLRAGDMITTGACVPPLEVQAGDALRADFGVIGIVEAVFY